MTRPRPTLLATGTLCISIGILATSPASAAEAAHANAAVFVLVDTGTPFALQALNVTADSAIYAASDLLPKLRGSYGRNETFGPHFNRERFRNRLIASLREMDAVDIFQFHHTNTLYTILATIPEELRSKLRLVYNAGCTNAADSCEYLSRGAKAYIGHPGISCSPIFTSVFVNEWLGGNSLRRATEVANHLTRFTINADPFNACALAVSDGNRRAAYAQTEAYLFGDATLNVHSTPQSSPPYDETDCRARRTTDTLAGATAPASFLPHQITDRQARAALSDPGLALMAAIDWASLSLPWASPAR